MKCSRTKTERVLHSQLGKCRPVGVALGRKRRQSVCRLGAAHHSHKQRPRDLSPCLGRCAVHRRRHALHLTHRARSSLCWNNEQQKHTTTSCPYLQKCSCSRFDGSIQGSVVGAQRAGELAVAQQLLGRNLLARHHVLARLEEPELRHNHRADQSRSEPPQNLGKLNVASSNGKPVVLLARKKPAKREFQPQIAAKQHSYSATETRAIDPRDQRLCKGAQALKQMLRRAGALLRPRHSSSSEVHSRAKELACPGQHHGKHRTVLLQHLQMIQQGVAHCARKSIPARRAIQSKRGNPDDRSISRQQHLRRHIETMKERVLQFKCINGVFFHFRCRNRRRVGVFSCKRASALWMLNFGLARAQLLVATLLACVSRATMMAQSFIA